MPKVSEAGTKPRTGHEERLQEPEEYSVILLNDDYTTMDFVVAVLVSIFRKSPLEAERIMLDVHNKGRGTVGVYPWDIATTRAEQVRRMARREEFPLRCVVEKA